MNKVKNLIFEPTHKLISFDIVDLYTNIPVAETLRIPVSYTHLDVYKRQATVLVEATGRDSPTM